MGAQDEYVCDVWGERPKDEPSRHHEPKPIVTRVSCEGGRANRFTSKLGSGNCVRGVEPAVNWKDAEFGEKTLDLRLCRYLIV
jgi:hypothetical protein